jgi:predicted GIY-YIG superfamily endonuclease
LAWSKWWTYVSEVVTYDRDNPGVYELADDTKNTLYYGSGKLKTRLQDHLNKKECPLAKYYRFEYLSTEAQCKVREEELLTEYQKTHGRLPMYNERVG